MVDEAPEPATAAPEKPLEARAVSEPPPAINSNPETPATAAEVKPEPKPRPEIRRFRLTEAEKACPKCGKEMKSRSQLRKHLNRVYPCDGKKDLFKEDLQGRSCQQCGKTFTTQAELTNHMSDVHPCDAPRPKGEVRDKFRPYKCEKCQTTLSTAQKLRLHLARVNPCDNSEPRHRGPTNRTCPKCNTTFCSTQKLRLHLTRVTPCDVQKPLQGKEESDEVRICHKCQARFSSLQGLRLHENRVTPCDQEKRLMPGQDEEELVQRLTDPKWAKAVDALSHGYGKCIAAKAPPQSHVNKENNVQEQISCANISSTNADQQQTASTSAAMSVSNSPPDNRKRSAGDDGGEVSIINETSKRIRCASEKNAEMPTQDTKNAPMATTVGTTRNTSTKNTANVSGPNKHGGDILSDGCCCTLCVKSWASKMSVRLHILGDEVITLRDLVAASASDHNFETSTSPKEEFHSDRSSTLKSSKDAEVTTTIVNRFSLHASSCSNRAGDSVRASLTKKYNRLNEQISTNERALDDSVDYLKKISGHDESGSTELRSQIDELRVYVNVEKSKRDKAVAAVVAHRWNTTRDDFKVLLENMKVISRPIAEKMLHEECADIARQVSEKEEYLEELDALLKSADSCVEKELNNYAIQRAAKDLLEHERDEIFMRLLRSSRRIYLHTKEILSIDD